MTKQTSIKPVFKTHQSSLKVGQKAPNFSGIDTLSRDIKLSDFSGKKLILFFYPKDNTPGCTAEACNLRDNFSVLQKKGFAVLGVSADSVKKHANFTTKNNLPFPLLADTELSAIKAYDVYGQKMMFGKIYDGIVRTTFIIDEKGMIINVIQDVDCPDHAAQILTNSN